MTLLIENLDYLSTSCSHVPFLSVLIPTLPVIWGQTSSTRFKNNRETFCNKSNGSHVCSQPSTVFLCVQTDYTVSLHFLELQWTLILSKFIPFSETWRHIVKRFLRNACLLQCEVSTHEKCLHLEHSDENVYTLIENHFFLRLTGVFILTLTLSRFCVSAF